MSMLLFDQKQEKNCGGKHRVGGEVHRSVMDMKVRGDGGDVVIHLRDRKSASGERNQAKGHVDVSGGLNTVPPYNRVHCGPVRASV